MNSKHLMIAAAVAALWYWHKKRSTATPETVSTDTTASAAQDAQGWMGAWGLSK